MKLKTGAAAFGSSFLWLSDTMRLSDKQRLMYTADVRYFAVIGQIVL